MAHRIAVIGGDGIGPEVTAEALKVVRAAGVAVETVDFDLGGARYLRDGEILGVVSTEIKRRRDSVEQYRAGNRGDLAEKEEAEIQILQEFQSVRTKLTPKQVKERNKGFLKLKPCLEKRGWKITTTTNEIGLITPVQFTSPDGTINSRDLNQCSAQNGLFKDN